MKLELILSGLKHKITSSKYVASAKDAFSNSGEATKNIYTSAKTSVKDFYSNTTGSISDFYVNSKTQIRNIAVVGTMTLAGAGALGYSIHKYEKFRDGKNPLAFSEWEQLDEKFNKEGRELPGLTACLSKNNDLSMKIMESFQIARSIASDDQTFARELETRYEPALKEHTQIQEITKDIKNDCDRAISALSKFTYAANDLPNVHNSFKPVWKEDHEDFGHYETHYRTVCSTDSEGKQSCRQESYEVYVYDYTIHTYDYFPEAGRQAAKLLNEFVVKHPELKVDERLYLASDIGEENAFAIERSRRHELKGKILSANDKVALANSWATGSKFNIHSPKAYGLHVTLKGQQPSWDRAKNTARSSKKKNTNRSDDGPQELQLVKSILSTTNSLNKEIHEVIDGVNYIRENAIRYDGLLRDAVQAAYGNNKKLSREKLTQLKDLSEKSYNMNYENTFEFREYSKGMVIFLTLLGAAGGLFGGIVTVNYLDSNRRDTYRNGI